MVATGTESLDGPPLTAMLTRNLGPGEGGGREWQGFLIYLFSLSLNFLPPLKPSEQWESVSQSAVHVQESTSENLGGGLGIKEDGPLKYAGKEGRAGLHG